MHLLPHPNHTQQTPLHTVTIPPPLPRWTPFLAAQNSPRASSSDKPSPQFAFGLPSKTGCDNDDADDDDEGDGGGDGDGSGRGGGSGSKGGDGGGSRGGSGGGGSSRGSTRGGSNRASG
ncbi:keratin, type II cytoskeletal 2 epidermal [Zea mays]|uniref:keratin, type II cytoskeletal 2 epidermal n=1 Tax=Zea mays TaxID=4577 RepID=UPI001652318C|nr:keratin, type II cytoskeletal 2 epidermal-like [Zea mays]